jgi:hypothetical protein
MRYMSPETEKILADAMLVLLDREPVAVQVLENTIIRQNNALGGKPMSQLLIDTKVNTILKLADKHREVISCYELADCD